MCKTKVLFKHAQSLFIGKFRCILYLIVMIFLSSARLTGQNLTDTILHLNEVTIEARHERKELTEARQQGVPVSVIDGKMLAGRGTSIVEVINHQTGVKIRRVGAVGSETKVNVRGLEGNRVQIYMDGKPLNTPDGSFNINDIPLQYIDRIEIYKGIVPPEFGGDGDVRIRLCRKRLHDDVALR